MQLMIDGGVCLHWRRTSQISWINLSVALVMLGASVGCNWNDLPPTTPARTAMATHEGKCYVDPDCNAALRDAGTAQCVGKDSCSGVWMCPPPLGVDIDPVTGWDCPGAGQEDCAYSDGCFLVTGSPLQQCRNGVCVGDTSVCSERIKIDEYIFGVAINSCNCNEVDPGSAPAITECREEPPPPPPPPPGPPAAPEAVVVSPVSRKAIDVTWQDKSDNERKFRIERKRGDAGPFLVAGETSADDTSFRDTGLECGTSYAYIVFAVNRRGETQSTNEDRTETNPC